MKSVFLKTQKLLLTLTLIFGAGCTMDLHGMEVKPLSKENEQLQKRLEEAMRVFSSTIETAQTNKDLHETACKQGIETLKELCNTPIVANEKGLADYALQKAMEENNENNQGPLHQIWNFERAAQIVMTTHPNGSYDKNTYLYEQIVAIRSLLTKVCQVKKLGIVMDDLARAISEIKKSEFKRKENTYKNTLENSIADLPKIVGKTRVADLFERINNRMSRRDIALAKEVLSGIESKSSSTGDLSHSSTGPLNKKAHQFIEAAIAVQAANATFEQKMRVIVMLLHQAKTAFICAGNLEGCPKDPQKRTRLETKLLNNIFLDAETMVNKYSPERVCLAGALVRTALVTLAAPWICSKLLRLSPTANALMRTGLSGLWFVGMLRNNRITSSTKLVTSLATCGILGYGLRSLYQALRA